MEVPRLWGQRKEGGGRKDVMGFLGKAGSKTGKMAVQRLECQASCKTAVSTLGKVSPFFVQGEATVLQVS